MTDLCCCLCFAFSQVASGHSPHAEPGDDGKTVVILMVRDAYANYVVQTTLDVIPESEEKQLLLKELNSHADDLVSLFSF